MKIIKCLIIMEIFLIGAIFGVIIARCTNNVYDVDNNGKVELRDAVDVLNCYVGNIDSKYCKEDKDERKNN